MKIFLLEGKIEEIFERQQITERFAKQEFILKMVVTTDNSTTTEYIKFQCVNAKISLLDSVDKGDFCIIDFNITGRRYKKEDEEPRYFDNHNVQNIRVIHPADSGPQPVRPEDEIDYSDTFPGINSSSSKEQEDVMSPNYEDDLPF